MLYRYIAFDKDGKKVNGTVYAKDKTDFLAQMKESGLHVQSVHETDQWERIGKVTSAELLLYTRMIAQLFKARLPILDIFNIAEKETPSKPLKQVSQRIKAGLRRGESLHQIMEQHGGIFPPVYRALVKTGETVGKPEILFSHLVRYLEFMDKNRKEISNLLIYPFIVLVMAFFVLLGVVLFLIPQFSSLYDDLGVTLPFATGILFKLSTFMKGHSDIVIITLLLLMGTIVFLWKFGPFKNVWSKLRIRIPMVGNLLAEWELTQVCFAWGTLLKYKADMIESIDVIASIYSPSSDRERFREIKDGLRRGERLSALLAQTGLFKGVSSQLIAGGEASGELPEMLMTVSDYYRDKLESDMKVSLALLQPALILFLGLLIGFIVVSVFLPIFRLSEFI